MAQNQDWRSALQDLHARGWRGYTVIGVFVGCAVAAFFIPRQSAREALLAITPGQMPACDSTVTRHLLTQAVAGSPAARTQGLVMQKVGSVRDAFPGMALYGGQRTCVAEIYTNAGRDTVTATLSWTSPNQDESTSTSPGCSEPYLHLRRRSCIPITTTPSARAPMDWFERITVFREGSYAQTQAALSVREGRLQCRGAERSYAVGTLTLPSLAELRQLAAGVRHSGRSRISTVYGDVRALHRAPENQGALFQVASQFNMLEMVGPHVTPEDGVTGYAYDATQGPACAMAAGAATIYRNYLVPIGGEIGQTRERQLDGLADLGAALAQRVGKSRAALYTMRNGYALPSSSGLTAIGEYLSSADDGSLDELRSLLRVGLHTDVEVTDGPGPGPVVSQLFCSALPAAYSDHPAALWAPFARLVLEAAYETTLLAGVVNAARGGSNRVLLTRLGGGAFGNADAWIDEAMQQAVQRVEECDLDIVVVRYRSPS